jgi:hypothetical protein
MKPVAPHSHSILLLAIVTLIFSSCKEVKGGKIPFDEAKAREQIIPVRQGSEYSLNFVKLRDSVLPRVISDSLFLGQRFNLPIAETFNRDAIIALLNADGAQGVRVYFGNDDKGLVRLVLMPVDKDGKDIVTQLTGQPAGGKLGAQAKLSTTMEGESVENGQRPPPPYSGLNPGN